MPDGGEPTDESIPSERPLDRPYFPYWFLEDESVPGAFDDAFYEVVESERTDGTQYYANLRFSVQDWFCGQGPLGDGQNVLHPPDNSYQHLYTLFPKGNQAPFHPPPNDEVQLLGADAYGGRNGVWDICGVVNNQQNCEQFPANGIPETEEVRWLGSGWEYNCGVYGVSSRINYGGTYPLEIHAFVAAGDIRRSARTRLNNSGDWTWGAERWPGATDKKPTDPPPGLPESTGEDAKKTFCQRIYCPDPPMDPWQNFLLVVSIHELGHTIGNLQGDTENCKDALKNPIPLEEQTVMDYECIRRGFGPDGHGVKWFGRADLLQMRQGGEPQ